MFMNLLYIQKLVVVSGGFAMERMEQIREMLVEWLKVALISRLR